MQEDGTIGSRFLRYDVADWPLVVASVPEDANSHAATLDDIRLTMDALRAVMHVAKFGSDGNGRIPGTPHATTEDDEIGNNLPSSLRGLKCGPISTIVDLTKAKIPPMSLIPAVIELVQLSEQLAKNCVVTRVVILNPSLKDIARMVTTAAGGISSKLVTSEDEAFRYIEEGISTVEMSDSERLSILA